MEFKRYLAAPMLALLVATSACDDGLTEINRNPNEPEDVPSANLLINAIRTTIGGTYGTHGVWAGLYLTNIWSQQIAQVAYNDEDKYIPRPAQVDGIWDQMYTGPLADYKWIKDKAEAEGDDNLWAVAQIMSMYVFHYLTDVYGAIPFSEALGGAENPHPKYDPQPEVYDGILAGLKAAAAKIDPSASTSSWAGGDPIYGGDMEAWRKFANSLRLRVAMRMSAADPAKARAEFVDAYNAGVFESNDDNALMHWGSAYLDENPRYDYYYNQDRYDFAMSKAMIDKLVDLNDPRLPIYADPARADGQYRGLPNGETPSDINLTVNHISSIGAYFLKADAPSDIMTYAEVLFLAAEAAAEGWIAGDPADLYRQAITASMKRYGIAQADIDAYLAQPSVAYSRDNLYEQKWIALFLNGPEGWAEQRRTGIPVLKPAAGDKIPARLYYPSGEQLYNYDNWAAAGGPNVTLFEPKLWWQR